MYISLCLISWSQHITSIKITKKVQKFTKIQKTAFWQLFKFENEQLLQDTFLMWFRWYFLRIKRLQFEMSISLFHARRDCSLIINFPRKINASFNSHVGVITYYIYIDREELKRMHYRYILDLIMYSLAICSGKEEIWTNSMCKK